MSINYKEVVHHGVEGLAFLAVGTYTTASFSSTCAAYAAGKTTYVLAKEFFKKNYPAFEKDTQRNISFVTALLVGGATLQFVMKNVACHSTSFFQAMVATLGFTAISLGARFLGDKTYTFITKP